jgi:hypothetical protein
MQPYIFPYLGYFQLLAAVDLFVVYDNIKYTKKGWINRNRFLQNGRDVTFTIPLKAGSDYLDIRDREVAAAFDREKLLNQIRDAYRRAPYFEDTFAFVERVLRHDDRNLFGFLQHSLAATCSHLGIGTKMVVSSAVEVDPELKAQARVLATCEAMDATTYINATGGVGLYSRDAVLERGVELRFIRSNPVIYSQFDAEFVPSLSIVDVMMFNSVSEIRDRLLNEYELD